MSRRARREIPDEDDLPEPAVPDPPPDEDPQPFLADQPGGPGVAMVTLMGDNGRLR